MESFCKNLRARAVELGISNAEAARRIRLSERRYAHYVSGDREPDLATLLRISVVLGVSLDNLLGSQERQPSTGRDLLLERIQSAAHGLSDSVLEVVAQQVEALSAKK